MFFKYNNFKVKFIYSAYNKKTGDKSEKKYILKTEKVR